MYRNAKPVELCQCYTEGVSLADAHGAADLLGDDHATQVVNATDNSGSFHIYKISLFDRFVLLVSAKQGDLYCYDIIYLRIARGASTTGGKDVTPFSDPPDRSPHRIRYSESFFPMVIPRS